MGFQSVEVLNKFVTPFCHNVCAIQAPFCPLKHNQEAALFQLMDLNLKRLLNLKSFPSQAMSLSLSSGLSIYV